MNAKTIRLVAEIARRKKRLAEGRKKRWEKIAKAMDKIPTSMSCVTLCKNPPKIGSVATYASSLASAHGSASDGDEFDCCPVCGSTKCSCCETCGAESLDKCTCCPRCGGRGKVTTEDYESYFGANYKPCPVWVKNNRYEADLRKDRMKKNGGW